MREGRLSDELLARVSQTISQQLGLFFPRERWRDLERGLDESSVELGVVDSTTLAQRLIEIPFGQSEIDVLGKYLTVGESYFFRNRRNLRTFKKQVIPELLASRRSGRKYIRIWSAGCCRGEEPYSLAMILRWMLTLLRRSEPTKSCLNCRSF